MASVPKKIRKDRSDSKSDTSLNKSSEEKDTRTLCERVNCPTDELTCVLEVCHQCINRENADTTNHPWMHLSLGEHVCNVCVEFYTRSQGIGYQDFSKWKRVWTANARSESVIGTFIGDQLLPYWTQCMRCSKWREMGRHFNLSKDLAEQFICTKSCDEPEDERVIAARQPHWINTLLYPPYLTQSPAEVYLKGYYPDAVGMSATEKPSHESGGDNFTRPFHESPSNCMALSIRPDVMDYDETLEFREFAAAQQMYLCLRNLVVASWAKNNMEWLTLDKCRHSVICRGLVRIRCLIDLERIITFLTSKGVINAGILPHPPPSVFVTKAQVGSVIVVGAGTAGLAAALHLYKLGVKVTVLEAKERLGGRVQASRLSSGALLTLGPDIINGSINNPIAMMARQCKLVVQEFPLSNIVVLGKQNRAINADSMRRAENRYLEILDLIYEWAHNNDNPECPDVSLREKVKEMNAKLNEEEDGCLNEEEEQILELHLMTLAMGTGCTLEQMSAKYWNVHEEYPQFGGPSFIVKQGIGTVLNKMAANLNIEYRKEVEGITYGVEGQSAVVRCKDGTAYPCDRVICTASLQSLQNRYIGFLPDLPSKKLAAIQALKCGKLEKVVMHFKKKFWAPKMHGVRLFTSLTILNDQQCPFHIIHDASDFTMSSNNGHVLAMYVSGEKLEKYNTMRREEKDAKLGAACLDSIKKMFAHATDPMSTSVSSWSSDHLTGMSRSYLPIGVDNLVYGNIGEPVSDQLFFAGEATLSSHPNLVTGAYLSGVRAAIEILSKSAIQIPPS